MNVAARSFLAALVIPFSIAIGHGEVVPAETNHSSQLWVPLTCITICDDTEDTLATRCSVTGSDHNPYFPNDGYTLFYPVGYGYFYASGIFSVIVPTGQTIIRLGHGFEYAETIDTVDITGDTTITYRLDRIIDMAIMDWYPGDCHVHIDHVGGVYDVTPKDVHLMGCAEGLRVVNCLDNGYHFTGAVDSCSTDECIVYMSEEYRSSTYGHMDLLGLTSLIQPFSSSWYPMTMDVADSTHRQAGALVISAHPVSSTNFDDVDDWPGSGIARELPVDVVTSRIDGFEVMCYSNCRFGGIELDMWYRLLNCGFRLPACAGTDACMNIYYTKPLGGFKTYVFIPSAAFDYPNWLSQLADGRTFISNGPLFTRFEICDYSRMLIPGDSLEATGELVELYGMISIWCAHPLDRFELVINGEVAQRFNLYHWRDHVDTSFTVTLDESSWIAARVFGSNVYWFNVGNALFAHTSPIYVTLNGERIVNQDDAQYFADWIADLEELTGIRGSWSNPEDSIRVFREFETARLYYEQLASGVTAVEESPLARGRPVPYLYQNSPNPFSTGTFIEFGISPGVRDPFTASMETGVTAIPGDFVVYDVQGRFIRRLYRGALLPGERMRIFWDGKDHRGREVTSGVYFCRLSTAGWTGGRKMLLLR
ncbi:MAG: CehA/McbA family metallohydrolase [bacterium]|nr:MAG: CehA/McbA family metallohydrolase [bacterium]